MLFFLIPFFLLITVLVSSGSSYAVSIYTGEVRNVYPHDSHAFTQGLAYDGGVIYEGTGVYGKSSLRRTELESGRVLKIHALSDDFFGEGVTVFNSKIIQLTWRSRTGFVYDKKSFKLLRTFDYPAEGWGITHDGERLIMSDGTAALYFLNPDTYEVTGQVEVHDQTGPVLRLNELEYVRGEIYANVWRTDRIAIINPGTGRVRGWIDLEGLSRQAGGDKTRKTLNGIAYDEKNNRLFVTGKLWHSIYEIRLKPVQKSKSAIVP